MLLVGLTSLAAALLATLEADSGRRAGVGRGLSPRRPAVLRHRRHGPRDQLRREHDPQPPSSSTRRQTLRTAFASSDPLQQALARADARTAARLAELDESSLGVRTGAEGLQAAVGELRRAATRQQAALRLQNAAVDEADRYGRRQSRSVFGLALLATAGALLGLAGVLQRGRPGWLALGTGGAALVASVATGASALLV